MSQIVYGTGAFAEISQKFHFSFGQRGGWTLQITGDQSQKFWQSCCTQETAIEFFGEIDDLLQIYIPKVHPIAINEFIAMPPSGWPFPFQIIRPDYADDRLFAYLRRIVVGYLPCFGVKNRRLTVKWRRSD